MSTYRDQRLSVDFRTYLPGSYHCIIKALFCGHIRTSKRFINIFPYKEGLIHWNMIILFKILWCITGIGITVNITVFSGIPVHYSRIRYLIEDWIICICQFIQCIDHIIPDHAVYLWLPPAKCDQIRQCIRSDQRIQLFILISFWCDEVDRYSGFLCDRPGYQIFAPSSHKPGIIHIPVKCHLLRFFFCCFCLFFVIFMRKSCHRQYNGQYQGKTCCRCPDKTFFHPLLLYIVAILLFQYIIFPV